MMGSDDDTTKATHADGTNAAAIAEKAASGLLRVHKFDGLTRESRPKMIVEIGQPSSIKGQNLTYIRSLLVNENALSSKNVGSMFCDASGVDVKDSMDATKYFGLLGCNVETGPFDVYYKDKRVMTSMSDETKEFLAKGVDLTTKQSPELLKSNASLLNSTLDASKLIVANGNSKAIHAADLTERDWSVVARTNSLLSGHRLVLTNNQANIEKGQVGVSGLERSPYPAFAIKPRAFAGYEVSAPLVSSGVKTAGTESASSNELQFRIPRFRVEDGSDVKVFETKTALQKSMADSSFSETSVEASGGGGFWGVSAGFSAGAAIGSSSGKVEAESKAENLMHVTYNFPRVTVYLDATTLEITDECKEDIKLVKDKASLAAFTQKYGQVFARKVELGGRLSSSEATKASTTGSNTEQANSLKASAAASFSTPYAQASVSASHENQNKSGTSNTNQSSQRSMAWTATGGDTLLSSNPPVWAGTVASFYTWRVIKQDDVVPIYQMLDEMASDTDDIADRFERSAKGTYEHPGAARIKFKLDTEEDSMPLLIGAGGNRVATKTSNELGSLPKGTPVFDTYREDLLKSVKEAPCEILLNQGTGTNTPWLCLDMTLTVEQATESEPKIMYENWYGTGPSTHQNLYCGPTPTKPQYFEKSFLAVTASRCTWRFHNLANPGRKGYVQNGDVVAVQLCNSGVAGDNVNRWLRAQKDSPVVELADEKIYSKDKPEFRFKFTSGGILSKW